MLLDNYEIPSTIILYIEIEWRKIKCMLTQTFTEEWSQQGYLTWGTFFNRKEILYVIIQTRIR